MAGKNGKATALSGLAAAILARDDGAHVDVPCPEWDCTVRLAVMTLAERAAWSEKVGAVKDPGLSSAILICCCARNADGTPLFTLDQAAALAGKSGVVLERLTEAALKLNKLRVADREAAVKN